MENATKTVLLCGVGGQGTILAADLLAFSCMKAGLQVKVSEIHGMAQRGGAVTTVVRVGEDVKSMVSDAGCADVVVAFETTEALRNLPQLKEGGSLIVNDVAIRPLPVLTGAASMPENARERLREAGALLIDRCHCARGRQRQMRQCGARGGLGGPARHSRRGVGGDRGRARAAEDRRGEPRRPARGPSRHRERGGKIA